MVHHRPRQHVHDEVHPLPSGRSQDRVGEAGLAGVQGKIGAELGKPRAAGVVR
jgi:hypothetical protein